MSAEAVHGNGENLSFRATAAMATLYTAVKLDVSTGDNYVDIAAAATDRGIGFTQTTQSTVGGPITIRTSGFSLARCSGGWTRGDRLTPTTGGALVTTTTAANLVCAIAMNTVSSGENGEVQIVSPAIRYDGF